MTEGRLNTIRQKYPFVVEVLLRARRSNWLRAGGILLFANAIVVVFGIIRTPLLTWVLPKDEVGMIGVLAAWFPFVQLLSLSGLDSAAYHYAAKGQSGAFRVNLRYRLRWSLLTACSFFLGAIFWFSKGDVLLTWMFIIAGLSFPFTAGLSACAGLLSAEQRFKSLFWYRIFESLTDFTGFIPLIFSFWAISKVVSFYTANQFATAIMMVGVSLVLIRQSNQSNTQTLTPEDEAELVRYGKHLTGISAISVLHTRTDALLIGLFLPLGTMADYSIALLISEQFKRLWIIYVTLRYTPLVRMPLQQRRRRFVQEGTLLWVSFVVIGIMIALLGHWLIPILLPAAYTSSLGFMDILIAAFVVGLPGNITELFYRSCQDEKSQYLMRLFAAVIGVSAPIILLLRLGGIGVALGRMAASLVLSIIGIYLFVRGNYKSQIS